MWAIDTSPVGQRQTAKDWVYPPDLEREVTNQSLGNLVTLMKVADKAAKEKRNLTMTGDFKRSFQCNATSSNSHPFLLLVLVSFLIAEMDVIMKSISVSKEAYATEETRAAKAAKADADLAAQRARKNRAGAAAAAKGRDRVTAAEQVVSLRGQTAVVAREAAAKGKDRRRAKIAETVAAARQTESDDEEWTGTGRPKRA